MSISVQDAIAAKDISKFSEPKSRLFAAMQYANLAKKANPAFDRKKFFEECKING